MRYIAYSNAEQQQRVHIQIDPLKREQLARLRGYLEGVGAPKAMQEAFNELFELAVRGESIGPAVS